MMAPVVAVQKLLPKIGWKIGDVDLVELNEAFAVQAVAVTRELGLDPARVNVNGGAVALGHPDRRQRRAHPDDPALRDEADRRQARHRDACAWAAATPWRSRSRWYEPRARGRRRRRHDGQRHRAGVRAARVPGAAARRRARGARSRAPAIEKSLGKFVEKGKLRAEDRDAALGRLEPAASLDALADVDFVVEAVAENAAVKREVFGRLDALTRPDVILASNTSSISITDLAAATKRPDRVLGMHFMNPVPLMTLVEVIRGQATTNEAMRTATELAAPSARRRSRRQTTPASSPTAS